MRMIGSAARSRGRCGSPYFASSAGWAQATIRMVPRRVATMLLSARSPIRTARSTWSLTRSALRSLSSKRTRISG